MHDIAIHNATVYDGTGKAPFTGSLAVQGARISGVWHTATPPVPARKVIDAGGLALCPGFIDTHTHSDLLLLQDGRQPSSITQGVTSEILGQDGLAYAPLDAEKKQDFALYLKGLNGYDGPALERFADGAGYLACLDGSCGVNTAWLAPHGAIRLQAAGFAPGLLNARQLAGAKALLRTALDQGAKGLSTGLSYYPGAYCDTEELVALCGVVAEMGGVYVTHLRSVFCHGYVDPVEEALDIARRSGVKLHFSHYRTGAGTLGQTEEIMCKIDEAIQREGLDITLELYPYPYGASYSAMFLPPWASEGGFAGIMRRLEDEGERKRIAAYIDEEFTGFDAVISYAGEQPDLEGQRYSALARQAGETVGGCIARLLYTQRLALGQRDADPGFSAAREQLFQKDVFDLLARPYYTVGSDAIHLGGRPHPRAWGSYARLLRMAREARFPLQTLVQRMTALPAGRFALTGRGTLKVGNYADMVVFDPAAVSDRATEENPRAVAAGYSHVLVNGQFALENGIPTGALAGRAL